MIIRRLTLTLLVTTALGVTACGKKAEAPPPPPPEVVIAEVVQRDVPIYVENIGETRGSEEVEVRARAQGFLESIDFQEGWFVDRGQLLYTIDPRELTAQLDQARATLAQAEAAYLRATQDVDRFEPLVEQNAIPRQEFERALSSQAAARAQVDAAKAQADRSAISLGYARITAPISGLIGKSEVSVGNLVGAGQATLLTTISKVDPIHVRFSISEKDFIELANRYGRGDDARNRAQEAGIELVLADGSVHPYKGRLAFTDRLIDPETGTLLLEAAFPNPDKRLRTGQYARVRFVKDLRRGAILVPQRAVQELQATFSVAVVSGTKVEIRPVDPGARIGTFRVIEQGLKPGEKVVVEGVQKVRNGIDVKATLADESTEPAESEAPAATEPSKEN